MRSPILKFFICVFSCTLFSCQNQNKDYFQGQVIYKYHYTSDVLNIDSLNQSKIHTSIFKYDTENYQSTFINKDSTTYFYLSSINKCLKAINGQLQDICEDYSEATDSIINFRVYDTDEKILGQDCMIIEFQGLHFWNRFYVSKDSKISPNTYKDHKAYNWQFYGNQTHGGLILKLEHRFKTFSMHGEATYISNLKWNEKALDITTQEALSNCN